MLKLLRVVIFQTEMVRHCFSVMKVVKMILLGLSLSLSACKSNPKTDLNGNQATANDNGSGKILDEKFLIVPGRSVGEISLGDDIHMLNKLLGKPDLSDAAMGKAWGIWFSKDSVDGMRNEIAIYSAYRDTSMRVKEVKQIRFTAGQFKTQDGYSTGRTLNDTKLKFPAIEKIVSYLNEKLDTVTVYDSKADGISFEFLKQKSIAITIHPLNQAMNNTYFTLHPNWKLIE